ncbi:hypothetical protein CGRA01v4_14182 [Colletotrichum graminicola]|nr:hypothetical protein CGRA01v4_14182 [Colletotrichum graminicola]
MISRSQVCALDPEKVAGSSPATVIAPIFLILPIVLCFCTLILLTLVNYCFCSCRDYRQQRIRNRPLSFSLPKADTGHVKYFLTRMHHDVVH